MFERLTSFFSRSELDLELDQTERNLCSDIEKYEDERQVIKPGTELRIEVCHAPCPKKVRLICEYFLGRNHQWKRRVP